MASRVNRLLAVSPREVRSLMTAEDWKTLNHIRDDAARVLYRYRKARVKRLVPAGLLNHVGALLIEYVRQPCYHAVTVKSTVLDVPLFHRLAWYNLEDLRFVPAAHIAERWRRSKHRSVRLQGVSSLCKLAPSSKIPLILRLMVDKDNLIAREAIWGVGAAIKQARLTQSNTRRVTQRLREIVAGQHVATKPDRVEALTAATDTVIGINEEDGIRFLCSEEVLRVGNQALREALLELSSPMRLPEPRHVRLLRKHLDPSLLWRVYEVWKTGQTLVSRQRQTRGSDDDQIAGILIHLASFVDPRRAETEIAALRRRRWNQHSMILWSIRDAEKVLRATVRKRKANR